MSNSIVAKISTYTVLFNTLCDNDQLNNEKKDKS